jgi:4-amino-4-deoxy-L-arabinose transferase-like glycosyltransferase
MEGISSRRLVPWAWLFTQLPVGTVAFRTNLMSALCAAATVGLICRVAQLILPAERYRLLSATAASLTLAFSALLWSQAVISEVYALLGLFSALEIWLLVRWRCGGGDLFLWLAALGLGVGLGNHLTLVFLVPASLFLLWPQRRRWLRARVLLPALALFLAGLGVYAYLPLAAAQRPPVNWGDPRVWNRFVWMVTAKQYQPFVMVGIGTGGSGHLDLVGVRPRLCPFFSCLGAAGRNLRLLLQRG